MSTFIRQGAILCLALYTLTAHAETAAPQTVDSLYERGQHELTSNWRPLGKLYNAAVFIHHDAKKLDKDRVAVWRHYEYPYPEYFEKENAYLSARERVVVDCKTARVGVSDSSFYSGRFASGAIVGENKSVSLDMNAVRPDSLEEQLVKAVCVSKPPRKQRSKPAPKAEPAKAADEKKAPQKTAGASSAKLP